MKFEPAQKLSDGKRHRFLFAAIMVVFVFKRYAVFGNAEDAVFGNGYYMCVPAQVFHHRCYAAKATFCIHFPFFKARLPHLFFYIHALRLQ